MPTGQKPAKTRRKNWEYSMVELNESHYQGVDVCQVVGDLIEVVNVKPNLGKASEKSPINPAEDISTENRSDIPVNIVDYDNLQQFVSDLYNNSQPTEITDSQDAELNGKGKTLSYKSYHSTN